MKTRISTSGQIEDDLIKLYGFVREDFIWISLYKSGIKIEYNFDFRFFGQAPNGKYYPIYLQRKIRTINEAAFVFHALTGNFLGMTKDKVTIDDGFYIKPEPPKPLETMMSSYR